MKYTIELEWEDVDAIIIKELQESHRINSTPHQLEDGLTSEIDFELIKSIENVLEYYMTPSQFDEWIKNVYSE